MASRRAHWLTSVVSERVSFSEARPIRFNHLLQPCCPAPLPAPTRFAPIASLRPTAQRALRTRILLCSRQLLLHRVLWERGLPLRVHMDRDVFKVVAGQTARPACRSHARKRAARAGSVGRGACRPWEGAQPTPEPCA
eukprot:3127599-Rhodomonas_salina.1